MSLFAQVQAASSWTDYLPVPLQMPVLYFILAVCLAAGMFCNKLPPKWQAQEIMPCIVLAVGLLFSYFLIPSSHVYALGAGLIVSMISIALFPLIINRLMSIVAGWLGVNQAQADNDSVPPSSGPRIQSTAQPPPKP